MTTVTSDTLNEESRRRPDFVAGTLVLLADGQSWSLRRPVVRFHPGSGDEDFQLRLALPGNPEFTALIKQRDELFGPDGSNDVPVSAVVAVELRIARMLLLANYDLAPDEVGNLLQFGYDATVDPASSTMREACIAVAYRQTVVAESTEED